MSLADMMTRAQDWMTPERTRAFMAVGQGLGQLGAGQPINLSNHYSDMLQQERMSQQMDALHSSGVLERFTPQQQAILAQMEPQAAQSIIAQALFTPPESPQPVTINGQLVDSSTGQVIGDYRTPEAPEAGYRQMTPEEVAATPGLDPGRAYQVAPDGKIAPIGGGPLVENHIGGEGETAFTEETGKILAREAATIVEQGSAAQRSMGTLVTLDAALASSPEGFAASLTKIAGDWGIKTEGASNLELANALISQMVPGQRPPGSGTMSDADLALFKASLPQLMNTAEGNKKIIETMRAIGEYDMARAGIARRQQLGEITSAQAFAEYAALGNPMADFVVPDGQEMGSATPPRPSESALTDEEWTRAWSAMTPEQRALFGDSN